MNLLKSIILLPLALAACAAPDQQPPLAGATIGGPFALIDQDGKAVTDRSFDGKYRIMYFGYTYCPDACPTAAQAIGGAMRLLDKSDPAVSANVVPVFVTVDPARDTPATLKEFVHAYYPRFVGLTGSAAQVKAAADAFRISFKKEAPRANGSYLVDHLNVVYLMSPDNKPLALLPTDQGPQATADEIRKWVK
ncbi:MAG: SCO family protein [Pseudomonadota bacterium]